MPCSIESRSPCSRIVDEAIKDNLIKERSEPIDGDVVMKLRRECGRMCTYSAANEEGGSK